MTTTPQVTLLMHDGRAIDLTGLSHDAITAKLRELGITRIRIVARRPQEETDGDEIRRRDPRAL